MSLLLTGARVVAPDRILEDGWVLVRGGRIVGVGEGEPSDGGEQVDLSGGLVAPGFVDMHVHGGGGAAFQSGDPREVHAAVDFHRTRGTTTLLASLVTSTLDELATAMAMLRDQVGEGGLAGIHLEGPFLAAGRCGAHDRDLLRAPTSEALEVLLRAGGDALAMVTIAPELDGGLDAVRRVVDAGAVVAVGHTDADYATTVAALDAGARVGTHLFNAMPALHHRAPGPVAALLEDDRVTVEIVVDGRHVHPSVVRATFRAAGSRRVAWVSDAIAAAGKGDGDYVLGGLAVNVRDGAATLAGGDSLAGSTICVADAVRSSVAAGIDVHDAVTAATATPARTLGLDRELGSIEVGKRADLVVLDADLGVVGVMQKGCWTAGN